MLVSSPVIDSMEAVETRNLSDAEYEWWRYSKLALPSLLLLLLVSSTLLCLTLWQGNLTIKQLTAGAPVTYLPAATTAGNKERKEGGLKIYNRNTRISVVVLGFVALLGIGITMYARPPPMTRKSIYTGLGALLFVAGCISGVAFGLDAGNVGDAVRCRDREQGNVIVPTPCESYEKLAHATTVVDLLVCFFSILTAGVLVMAASKTAADVDEEGWAAQVSKPGVTKTTKNCLIILLLATLFFLILLTTFTILLHETRDVKYADEIFNVRTFNNPKPGWPVKNTRLRIATASIVILTLLLNFIPFRSRVVAYSFAFVYFLASILCFAAWALDVKEIDTARDLVCPDQWDCLDGAFLATTFFDIFLGIVLLAYVLFEFVARIFNESSQPPQSL